MENKQSGKLRETVRILERKLGVLSECSVACCSVTMAQCHALVEIGRAGSLSLNELAEMLYLENSTMSRTVNNLVNRKLAIRNISSKDRRYVSISLTDEGLKLFKEIEEGMGLHFKRINDDIPEEKRGQVIESLNLLLKAIEDSNCCK